MDNQFFEIYLKTKLHMVMMAIILIGALNWLGVAFDYNVVEMLSNTFKSSFNTTIPFDKIIYGIVGCVAIIVMLRRSTWLPFLGKSVLPGALLAPHTPNNPTRVIKIKTKPKTKVAYWAAKNNAKNQDVVTAYGDYSNSGVVISDERGIAELPIVDGSGYVVPSGRHISRHIHYRVFDLPYGMMSKVKTIKY